MTASWPICRRLLIPVVFALVLAPPPVMAQALEAPGEEAGEPGSAWEVLVRANPAAAGELRLAERQILEQLTPEQGEALARGAVPEEIVLGDGTLLAELIAKMGSFTIPFWSADAGGGVSTGGTFTLTGTIGQPDAGRLISACFVIDGGFLPAGTSSATVFADGFEIGTAACWSSAVGSL